MPKRLANVEQVRDAILRDKFQQRQVERDEEDAQREQEALTRAPGPRRRGKFAGPHWNMGGP